VDLEWKWDGVDVGVVVVVLVLVGSGRLDQNRRRIRERPFKGPRRVMFETVHQSQHDWRCPPGATGDVGE
jgi:hypothetical protein